MSTTQPSPPSDTTRIASNADAAIIGGCHRGQNAEYLKEIDRLRGRPRVWVIFSHDLPQYHEQQDMTNYLDAIGTRLMEHVTFSKQPEGSPANDNASVFLYDLSYTNASAKISASTFPVADVRLDGRLSC